MRSPLNRFFISFILAILAACGGDSSSPNDGGGGGTGPTTSSESGIAIDGPLSGASVTFLAADGAEAGTTTTGANGGFDIEIPDTTTYPLTVRVSGGTDIVTGQPADIELAGLIASAGAQALITPFSTLAIRNAECVAEAGGGDPIAARNALTNESIAALVGDVFSYGLDSAVFSQLLSPVPTDSAQAASTLLSSEIFTEVLRRMEDAFSSTTTPLTADEILTAIACDIDGGVVDGTGTGSSSGLAGILQIISAEVGLEAASGQLEIAGEDATTAINNALSTAFGVTDVSVDSLSLDDANLSALEDLIYAAIAVEPSAELIDLYNALSELQAPVSTEDMDLALNSLQQDVDVDALVNNALSDPDFAAVMVSQFQVAQVTEDTGLPTISSFTSSATDIPFGGSVSLTWTATETIACNADGPEGLTWNGLVTFFGSEDIGPIQQNSTFTLTCANETGVSTASIDVTVPPLIGLAIDGPVNAGQVSTIDADNVTVAETTSDSRGFISVSTEGNASFPLTVRVTGGTDTVSGGAPDISLSGLVTAPGEDFMLTPFSTLAVRQAECAAERAGSDPQTARNALTNTGVSAVLNDGLDFGLHSTVRAQLLNSIPSDATQAASLLLASEMFVESLRRTATALGESADGVLTALACDLDNEILDGLEAESSVRLAAVFQLVAVEVGLEAAAGRLSVSGQVANTALNAALSTTFNTTAADVSTLTVGAEQLGYLQAGLHAALAAQPSSALLDAFSSIIELTGAQATSDIATVIDGLSEGVPLRVLIEATEPPSASFLAALENSDTVTQAPTIASFSVTPTVTAINGEATLNWTTQNATVCERAGPGRAIGWNGLGDASGSLVVGPVTLNSDLTLTCAGPGGVTTTETASVLVPPSVEISFSPAVVAYLENVTINFVATNAESGCTATRTPGGSLSNGQTVAGDIFDVTVTCNGRGGQSIDIKSLAVRAAKLTWTPPTQTESGGSIGAIEGYKIYHGTTSKGREGIVIDVPAGVTEVTTGFPTGPRYFEITAIADGGLESRFSDEAFKEIP